MTSDFAPNSSTNLQFARRYFENELSHRADGQASRGGRVDFVPDGVAVHLQQARSHGSVRSFKGRNKVPRGFPFIEESLVLWFTSLYWDSNC